MIQSRAELYNAGLTFGIYQTSIGNCKVCGAKGTIIDGHVHRGTDPVSASQNLPSSLQEKKDKLMKFLEKFPKDATNWNQATEELKDIYESLLDYSDNVIEDVNTSSSKTPAEYNTKFRDAIDKIIELCPEALGGLFRYYGAWFNENQTSIESLIQNHLKTELGKKLLIEFRENGTDTKMYHKHYKAIVDAIY